MPVATGSNSDGYTLAETEAAEILSSSANSQASYFPSPVMRPSVHPIVAATGRTLSSSFVNSYHHSFGSPQLPSSYINGSGVSASHTGNQHSPAPHQSASALGSFGSPSFPSSFGQAPLSYRSSSVSRSFNNNNHPSSGSHNPHSHSAASPHRTKDSPAHLDASNMAGKGSPLPPHASNHVSPHPAEEDDDLMDMDL